MESLQPEPSIAISRNEQERYGQHRKANQLLELVHVLGTPRDMQGAISYLRGLTHEITGR